MRVVKVGTKGVPHDDVSVCRCIDDFGISVFHRLGRLYRPEASSLTGATTHTAEPSAGIVFRF